MVPRHYIWSFLEGNPSFCILNLFARKLSMIVEAVWYLARDHTNWFSTVDYNMESVRKVKLAIQQYSSRVTKMVSDHNIDLYLDFKSIKGSVKLSEIMKSLVNCEPVLRYWS